MVDLVGGYDSYGFWILVFVLLFGGSILNALPNLIVKVTGIGSFIFGGVLLLGLIEHTVEKTPNLPSYANAIPLLFSIILLLVVLKMFLHSPKQKQNSKE